MATFGARTLLQDPPVILTITPWMTIHIEQFSQCLTYSVADGFEDASYSDNLIKEL